MRSLLSPQKAGPPAALLFFFQRWKIQAFIRRHPHINSFYLSIIPYSPLVARCVLIANIWVKASQKKQPNQ
jgi:hypothetical protein